MEVDKMYLIGFEGVVMILEREYFYVDLGWYFYI